MKAGRPIFTLKHLLLDYAPPVRRLTGRIRRLVLKNVPEAVERVYPGWRGVGYSHPQAGYFCAIFPMKDMVKLAFEYGARLPDPARLLKAGVSRGKSVRYLEFRGAGEVADKEVARLLGAAVRLKRNGGTA